MGSVPDQARRLSPTSHRAFLAVLLAGTALLGCFRLGTPVLWLDEAVSWFNSSGSWPHLWEQALNGDDCGGILYSVLLKLSMSVTGDSEFGLRLLSVVAMLALVAAMSETARCLWDSRTALVVGAVTMLHPSVLASGRQARGYVFVLLFTALCLMGLAWQWLGRRRASRVMLGAASLAVAATHVLGVAVAAGAAAASAALAWHLGHAQADGAGRLRRTASALLPFVPAFVFTIWWHALVGAAIDRRLAAFWIPGSALANYGAAAALLVLPLVAGTVVVVRADLHDRGPVVAAGLALMAIPVFCAPGVISVLARGRHNFVAVRYMYALVPLGILACGYALARLQRTACLLLVACAGVASLSYSASKHVYSPVTRGGHDVRAATAFLSFAVQRTDVVVVVPSWEWPTLAYYGIATSAAPPGIARNAPAPAAGNDRATWTVAFTPDAARDAAAGSRPQAWSFGTLQVVRQPDRR
jgi:mannosyltransferase